MLSRRPVLSGLGLLTTFLGLSLFVGCGSDSNLPTSLDPTSGSLGSDGAPTPGGSGDVTAGKSGQKTLPVLSPIVVSQAINGAVGGEVENGRYKVHFYPGAFVGTKTISLTDMQTDDGQCVLGPEGLQFSNLVTLTIDVKGTKYDSPFVTIEWWNPSTALWVDMAGVYNSDTREVYAVLRHFSTYRPRAGW